jgi:hypothetical protein
MTEKDNESGIILGKAAVASIQKIEHSLADLTRNLDYVGLEASKMPEYTQAKDAIYNYKVAVNNKIKLIYNETS